MARQPSLFPSEPIAFPPGFTLVENVISPSLERELMAFCGTLTFEPFVLMGQPSLRDTMVYGADYSSGKPRLAEAPPIPRELFEVREVVARAFGEAAGSYTQSVVTRYPAGAGIGWHADYRVFGPTVLGVALGESCRFKLRPLADPSSVVTLEMPARSAYATSGPARAAWQHSIPAVRGLRYSITFRTVLGRPAS